jgi:hypothetical protein
MPQEFEGVPVGSSKDNLPQLPPNWKRLWDAKAKRYYYYNTLDHDMQYELEKVYERAALTGAQKPDEYIDDICPDGVLSFNKNTISPSPVTHRSNDRARKSSSTESPVKNGGFVDMTGDSSDDDSSDDVSDSNRVLLKTPPPRKKTPPPTKKAKRSPLGSPKKTANPWAPRMKAIKKERPSWVDDVDSILGNAEDYVREVHTEELPNTQDFGGASALVALQSEPTEFDQSSTSTGTN